MTSTSSAFRAGRPTAPQGSAAAGHKGSGAELGGMPGCKRGTVAGYDQIAAEAGHRYRMRPGEACRFACERTPEQATARSSTPGMAGLPGFRLVIGVDDDPRAWVRVANALLARITDGAVRAGSRVPPVTGLGLESPVAPGTAARAFRALADEGVLHWVPGRGYYVRTGFTVPVSDRARQDGRLTAVVPVRGWPPHADGSTPASGNAER
jgi:DNA-binding transcriptional regulator YhcF (GntR family)